MQINLLFEYNYDDALTNVKKSEKIIRDPKASDNSNETNYTYLTTSYKQINCLLFIFLVTDFKKEIIYLSIGSFIRCLKIVSRFEIIFKDSPFLQIVTLVNFVFIVIERND